MQIIETEFYKKIVAEEGKYLHHKDNENHITREVLVPVTFTEEQIKNIFSEVEQSNFEIGDFEEKPVEEEKVTYTKLQIRRACRALEIEEKLNTLLKASETFSYDWQDAQEINLSDPVLLEALKQGSFTEEDIEKIKGEIENGTV